MYYPRILIISNNCLSKSDSNGRTLGNFVSLWPRDSIAQFCIHDQDKDWDVCTNFYAISDMQAVKSLLPGKKIDGRRTFSEEIVKNNSAGGQRTVSRTPASMLLRDAVWASMRWKNEMFNAWVNDFKPEAVILQAGDLPAFYDIAVHIAMERKIPLVIYNSEEYYFKDYCYFGEDASFKWLYPMFHNKLKKSVRNALNYAAGSIYISDYLKELYDNEFGKRSITLMTSATENVGPDAPTNETGAMRAIIYGGNLGVGRHKALIDIGNALQKINPTLKIDVYGKCDDPEIAQELNSCSGINYAGMIPYSDLQEKTRRARLLIHVESMKPYYVRDIKYGFSTKIADSLASGVPFFVYASSELTSVQYLSENKCAIIATDEKQLVDKLKCALFDEQARSLCITNARQIATMNHSQEKNKKRFYAFVVESITEEKD